MVWKGRELKVVRRLRQIFMAFEPINYDSGKTVELPFKKDETTTKHCVVVVDKNVGYYATGAGGANDVRYIALEAVTTTSTGEKVLCLPVDGVRFIADTTDEPVRADDVGTFVDLTNSTTLALGTSNDNVFYVEDIYGDTSDKKVVGYFMPQVAGT